MAGEPGLAPGFGIIVSRNQRELVLRLDGEAVNIPNRLEGQQLVVRRKLKAVHAPQANSPFAEEWRAIGAAEVLPALDRSGLHLAMLFWEDPQHAVGMGDRVEIGRLAPELARPQILSIALAAHRPRPQAAAVAAPGEEVWLAADIFCPTGSAPQCEWTCDAGEFVHAGGASAGKALKGPRAVRWRAPADPQGPPRTTIRLKATIPCRALSSEEALAINIEEPAGAYARLQTVPTRVRGAAGSRPGPLFAEASLLAAGPLDSVFVVDGPGRRLVHWAAAGPRFVPLGAAPVAALAAHGDTALCLQAGQLLTVPPDAAQPLPLAKAPAMKRPVGLWANELGDLYALDAGGPPTLHVLEKKAAGPLSPPSYAPAWLQATLEPKGDAAWLAHATLDPHSNDAFAFDSRDRLVRQWRALEGIGYHPLPVAMPAGSALDRFGPPIALLPRLDADHAVELPVQLVFKSGAVTDKWTFEPRPPRWQPLVRRPPREFTPIRFAAASAAPLPDGGLILGGQATVANETGPFLAQLSPSGELRRSLPLPELPPHLITATPDGRRYVLHAYRAQQRIVALGPDGWVARDLGLVEAIRPIVRLRPDRSSSDHLYVVGTRSGRESAIRLNILNPSAFLELSAQGFPGSGIPDHEAVDVATSPLFTAVLDRGGKVLLFANEKPLRYIGSIETGLRRPAALTLAAASHDAEGARQPFVCVLPSGREAACLHIWQVRTAGGGKPAPVKIGQAPQADRASPAALSSPVTLDSAFPDRPGAVYVLDRGGAQVRVFDIPAIAAKLAEQQAPSLPAAPILDKLPLADGSGDMAVGPGQLIHIADPAGEAVHAFARSQR